jgi:hypothetical protein
MVGYSTSPSLPASILHLQVANYEPGTRWFIPTDVGAWTAGGAVGLNGDVVHDVRLYYRSVGEGPDPNRMV